MPREVPMTACGNRGLTDTPLLTHLSCTRMKTDCLRSPAESCRRLPRTGADWILVTRTCSELVHFRASCFPANRPGPTVPAASWVRGGVLDGMT